MIYAGCSRELEPSPMTTVAPFLSQSALVRRREGHAGVWLASLLFFLMLFVPAAYQPIKAGLLACVLATITIQALYRGQLPLHRAILLWTLVSVATGLF